MSGAPITSIEKRCKRCGKTKPLDAFGQNRAAPDRKFSWCKSCRRNHRLNAQATPSPFNPSFSVSIRPGHMVHVAGIPDDLSPAEAAKIKRILLAHAEPEEAA